MMTNSVSSSTEPRRFKGIPVPFYFQENAADLFFNMDTQEDDVFLSSLIKGGTTWTNQILSCILHKFDDDGNVRDDFTPLAGQTHQLYPEATDVLRIDPALQNIDNEVGMEKARREFFGYATFQDLLDQPAPRMFSTHLFGKEFLPKQLTDPGGKGKLIIVLRNLKDTLASLHYFRGEAKDGWKGNEFGPGSLARFCADDCPNAYGSVFKWILANEEVAVDLHPTGRVCVVYFEALKMDLHSQLDRINAFLNLPPLTAAKRDAVAEAVGFKSMKEAAGNKPSSVLMRKGENGDWKNHMTREDWELLDRQFEKYLTGSRIAEPLIHFHYWDILGHPPSPRTEWTLDEDPRLWPPFSRVQLRDGLLVPDKLIAGPSKLSTDNLFLRPPSEFNNNVVVDCTDDSVVNCVSDKGGRVYVAESGRYHLFVSGVCPWANGVRAARYLLGLTDVIGMDIADGQSNAGWVFLNGTYAHPWSGKDGPFYLHEVYQAADSQVTTRITVPILWDQQTKTIVSNDSWDILKILSSAFARFHKLSVTLSPQLNLYPVDIECRSTIEQIQKEIYDALLNGVYKAGISLLKNNTVAYESAKVEVFNCLNKYEDELGRRDYLLPGTGTMTIVDVRMFMCLIRYDAAYRAAFALNRSDDSSGGGPILCSKRNESSAYPNLRAYIQRMYSQVKPEIDWPSFRQYYRWTIGHPSHLDLPSLHNLEKDARNEPLQINKHVDSSLLLS